MPVSSKVTPSRRRPSSRVALIRSSIRMMAASSFFTLSPCSAVDCAWAGR